jgi:hypothetical protein
VIIVHLDAVMYQLVEQSDSHLSLPQVPLYCDWIRTTSGSGTVDPRRKDGLIIEGILAERVFDTWLEGGGARSLAARGPERCTIAEVCSRMMKLPPRARRRGRWCC